METIREKKKKKEEERKNERRGLTLTGLLMEGVDLCSEPLTLFHYRILPRPWTFDDSGRASAYISHAMDLYRPQRSSPTV
jgi:hypothetical protein